MGACIGELAFGKKMGRRAIVIGLIGASLPDIDAIAGIFLSVPEELVAHRGITHSLLFGVTVPFLLAFIAQHLYRGTGISFRKFYFFFLLQVLLHDLLDSCNAYGTGLFEPFSDLRFSFNILYVADPLFSIWTIITTCIVLFYRTNRQVLKKIIVVSLALTGCYFLISLVNKLSVNKHLSTSLANKGISQARFFSTPTPFNNLLWYSVAHVDSGFFIGHVSVFDERTSPVKFRFFYKNEKLLDSVLDQKEVGLLKRFSNDFYTVEKWNDTLVFNVLRFGQMIGWQQPDAHFAFHYFLNPTYNNDLVVQRGRFEGWNRQTLSYMLRRIKGSIKETAKERMPLPKTNN
jgi:inner membrane protein